jgi:uncharacterized membrane protein YeiH
MTTLIHVLDLAGTAVFAITGALAAGRKRMDVFGVVVLGVVTALGGGTVRDLLLGSHPVFWVSHTDYLVVAAIAAIGTILFAGWFMPPTRGLVYADAIGLAVFTVVGFEKARLTGCTYGAGFVMGMTTAVVGGMIRDLLSGETPLILRREIYATASLCGAGLLAVLSSLRLSSQGSLSAALLVTLVIRLAALHWNLSLPLLRIEDDGAKGK